MLTEAVAGVSTGDPLQLAIVGGVVAVVVAGIGYAGQRATSRRLGQPTTQDGQQSTVADQLATLARGQVALVESVTAIRNTGEALERRVDTIEQTQLACVDCPRRSPRVAPAAGD